MREKSINEAIRRNMLGQLLDWQIKKYEYERDIILSFYEDGDFKAKVVLNDKAKKLLVFSLKNNKVSKFIDFDLKSDNIEEQKRESDAIFFNFLLGEFQ